MGIDLPPVKNLDRLKRVLQLVPDQERDDAINEAWIAHLDDRDPVQAVDTYRVRESRHRQRQTPSVIEDTDTASAGIEKRISQRLPAAPRQSNSKSANAA